MQAIGLLDHLPFKSIIYLPNVFNLPDRSDVIKGEPSRSAASALRRVLALRRADPDQGQGSLQVGRVHKDGLWFEPWPA